MIKAILFDLDGTLLPMDQDTFVKAYFGGICKRLAPFGYVPDELMKTIWGGTKAMVKNDGTKTNEEVFWDFFKSVYGEEKLCDMPEFEKFYQENFDSVASVCGFCEKAKDVIEAVKEKGFDCVLATNPIFPSIATHKRARWAGLDPSDFKLITTYENSHYCKPNPKYYLEILNTLSLSPEECVMVGNDVREDMIAGDLGIKTFLLTDCLIGEEGTDISKYENGGLDELIEFIKEL